MDFVWCDGGQDGRFPVYDIGGRYLDGINSVVCQDDWICCVVPDQNLSLTDVDYLWVWPVAGIPPFDQYCLAGEIINRKI